MSWEYYAAEPEPTREELKAEIERLLTLLADERTESMRLRARLEIDPSHPYDGIYARDETIRQQDKQIERLRAALGDILSYVPHGDLPLNLYDKARAALEGRT